MYMLKRKKKHFWVGILAYLLIHSMVFNMGITAWAADIGMETSAETAEKATTEKEKKPELKEAETEADKQLEPKEAENQFTGEEENERGSSIETLEAIPDVPADADGPTNLYEDGEGVFLSIVPAKQQMSRRQFQAQLEVGDEIPYPTNLGNYSTNYFTVNGRVAYCLESTKATPPASVYVANEFEENELLQKVLYYGYGGPGDMTDIYMPTFDVQLKYLFTHLAAAYAYCGIDGFAGCTMADIEACGVWGYVSYLDNLEAPPSTSIDVSPVRPVVYSEGETQRTPEFRLIGDHRCSVVIDLPENITCHYEGTEVTGSVEIFGGTRFYFSAPWDMMGTWDTGTLQNQLGQQWKAMVAVTGAGNQDVGYGDFTDGDNDTVRLLVDWQEQTKLQLAKRDKFSGTPLTDTVFQIYSDKECTNLIKEYHLKSVKGNYVYLPARLGKVYIKEITAPFGYRLESKVYEIQLEKGKWIRFEFPNEEQKGKITVQKQGEALTGVEGEEGTLVFRYENVPYSGAEYTVYAAEDIYSQDNVTRHFEEGDTVATMQTGTDGSALSPELFLGKYRVEETKAPAGLVLGETEEQLVKNTTLYYAGQDAPLAESMVTFTNERPEVSVKVVKKSKTNGVTLEGAVFGLYAESDITDGEGNVLVNSGTLIEQAVSDVDGNAGFQSDIPVGFSYTVKEIKAPENYYQSDQAFTFTYEYQDDETYTYTFEQEFQNEEVRGEIRIKKVDRDVQAFIPQGDAQLAGAEYGLYAAADIGSPDKKSGVIHQKGELIGQGKISDKGTLDFVDLYLGEYVVKEINPPEGYLLDETEYPVSLLYEGQDVKQVRKDVTVQENVKKQAFQLLKISEDGEQTEADMVEGAGFSIYLISNLSRVKDGSLEPGNGTSFSAGDFTGYDFKKEETAAYYENGEKVIVPELFTDVNGYLKSPELPYGDYVVIESTVPGHLHPVKPFLVHISEDSREPQAWRVFDDRPLEFLLKIVKKDAQTQAEVVGNRAGYRIYDVDAEKYVEMSVNYPKKEKISVFYTDEEGSLITPDVLKSGTYRIEEVQAPENYVQHGSEHTLSSDRRNIPLNEVTDSGEYQKTGEGAILVTVGSDTAYQIEEGAETPTVLVEQKNNEAVGSLALRKTGEKLKTVEHTQAGLLNKIKDGMASLANQISEFVTGDEAMEKISGYTFTYEEIGLKEVKFSVYARDTIYTPDGQTDMDGERIVRYEKDELVAVIETDENGNAVLNNLPIGKYYVLEEKTSKNHVLDHEKKDFEITYNGQESAVDYVELALKNERQKISLEVVKKDSVSGEPIEGVVFGLYAGEKILDAEGGIAVEKDTLIETGKTDKDGKLIFQSDLPHGMYYAKELEKKPGYLDHEDVYNFDASYTESEDKVLRLSCEVMNVPTVTEFTKTDLTDGQAVEGAKLQVLKDGSVAEEWISGKEPHTIYALEPGEYVLHEAAAPKGYAVAEDIEFTVAETAEVQKVEMRDERTMGQLKIHKTDSGSGEALEDVEFLLYEKSTGEKIAELVTDKEGRAESGMLPIGEYADGVFQESMTYVLKETKAKEGYQKSEEEWEVTFEYQDDQTPVIEVLKEIQNTKEPDTEQPAEKNPTEQTGTDEPESSGSAPKTGDHADYYLPVFGILIGGGCMLWAAIKSVRNRRSKRKQK